jgi:Ser/Thr protein kinase RdoA (MazF antagonist)
MDQALFPRVPAAPMKCNPDIPLETLAEIASRHFGIEGEMHALTSERDQNAEIICYDGRGYILKIANAGEDLDAIRLQNAALYAAALYPLALPLPKVVESRTGNGLEVVEHSGRKHAVRLLTRVEGVALTRMPISGALRADVGRTAAHIDRAFANLGSRGHRPILWDMANAPNAAKHLPLVEDPSWRNLLRAVFGAAESRALLTLCDLPKQWIHNDLNLNNLLAEPGVENRLSGVIDLGDMICAPRVVELAIASAHQAVRVSDPIEAAADVATAYCDFMPLAAAEVVMVPLLMAIRLAMAVIFQRLHAVEIGTGHFDLRHHEAFMATIDRLAGAGWDAAGDRLVRLVASGGGT